MTSGKFVKTNYDFDKETAWKQTGTGTLNIDGTISNFLAEAQTNSKLKYDGAGEAYMSNDPKDYESTVAYQHDSNGNYTGAITTKWKDGVPTAEKTLESYGATTKVAAKIDANGNAGEAESKNLIGEEVYSSASEEAWRDWQMGPMRAGNQVGNKWQAFKTGVWDWFRGHGKGGSLWD